MLVDGIWKEAKDEYTRFKETDADGSAAKWTSLQLVALEQNPQESSPDNQCLMCLGSITPAKQAHPLSCKHKIHNECILPWLNKYNCCPICLTDIPQTKL